MLRACGSACVRRGRTYVTIKTEMECGTAIASKLWKTHVLSAPDGDHAVFCEFCQYSSDVIESLVKL